MLDDVVPGIEHLEEVAVRPVGTVYRGVMPESKRTVAVTIVDALLTDQQRDRFEHEWKAMASVGGHPHVLTVLDAGITAKGHPYLVTEYLTRTLADFLAKNGTLRWQESVALGVEVASGLAAAHSVGVLHRDVTPENILMAYGDVPRLAGFGLARFAAAAAAPGTRPRFVHTAPEVLLGKPIDERADVYSLASIVYETIAGGPPFFDAQDRPEVLMDRIATAPPPSLASHGVPPEVEAVIDAGLAKDPEQRPPSAKAFAQQLLAAAKTAGETTAAMRRPTEAMAAVGLAGAAGAAADHAGGGDGEVTMTTLERREPHAPPRRWPALAGFAVVAALVIAGLAWIVGRGDDGSADGSGATTVPIVALDTTPDPTTTLADTSTTATTRTTRRAAAATTTAAPTTSTTTTTTTTLPGGFQVTGFSSQVGGTTFHIPSNGDNTSFEYQVTVAKNEAAFWCPVRTRYKHPEGPGLAKMDLGQCFPANDPPNKLTFRAFAPGRSTFLLWMCDGESTSRTCPGTRSRNAIEITVIADPLPEE